jgi:small-conductance mechanosensitive channel
MAIDWSFLNWVYAGNSIQQYLTALAIIIGVFLILKLFRFVILARFRNILSKKIDVERLLISKILRSLTWPFYAIISVYIGLRYLTFPSIVDKISYVVIFIFLVYYAIKILGEVIQHSVEKVSKKKNEEVDQGIIEVSKKILSMIIWVFAFLWILSNLGYNVTGLLAGVGIAGIAIGFALQGVLEDFFAFFSIHFDKPFKPGDFIIIGNDMGTIKKIGIKSTRIQSLQGQELVVSNKELTTARINNYKKMEKRRIAFTFGVTYDTSVKKLKKIPKIVKAIFDKTDKADIDRVHFKEYGDFSLKYEVVYYVDTNDYNVYMDVQQEVNLNLKEAFEKEKIEFAYPTQTIFLNK